MNAFRNLGRKLRVLRKAYGGQFVGAVIIAIGGALVASFQPLAAFVSSHLWHEKIEVGQNVVLTENQDTPVQLILRNRSTMTDISGGTVTVTAQSDAVRIVGPATFAFPRGTGAITVPGDGPPLVVRSMTPGIERLKVEVRTNRDARFTGFLTLQSQPSEPSVTANDLSGVWRVRLNDTYGMMTIRQRSRSDLHLTGTVKLDDGRELTITNGFRDGIVFQISAAARDTHRFEIDGVWCLMTQNGSRWMVVNARAQAFDGPARLRAAQSPGRLEEKCPDADALLSEAQGDGSFYASAPIGS